jgi:dethiobiotin synthetase
MAQGFFITGTDTDVGKTWIAAGLLAALGKRGYRTAAMKPLACGGIETQDGMRNEDALLLMQHASIKLPYEHVNPCLFVQPASPNIAAQVEGKHITLAPLKVACNRLAETADYVVVEGVGGWKVPVNETQTSADLAAVLELPVILVVGMRLGCLNHALLSCESIIGAGVELAGWVANSLTADWSQQQQNIATLQKRIAAPLLGIVPHLSEFLIERVASALTIDRLLGTRSEA